jgi:hypothetical protein
MTTRGFKDEEARLTANLIADVLDNPHDEANIAAVRAKVHALTAKFPVYQYTPMKCPFCGHLETQVVETRMSEDGDSIRRRRQCGACEKRYTTYERPDVSYPNVVKKDGRRTEFQRSKLVSSMSAGFAQTPCQHRATGQRGRAH